MAEPEAEIIETAEIPQEDIDLIQQLKAKEPPPKDIVRQVLQQNIDFSVKTLTEELGLSALDVGQAKATVKLEEKGRRSREAAQSQRAMPRSRETTESPKRIPKGDAQENYRATTRKSLIAFSTISRRESKYSSKAVFSSIPCTITVTSLCVRGPSSSTALLNPLLQVQHTLPHQGNHARGRPPPKLGKCCQCCNYLYDAQVSVGWRQGWQHPHVDRFILAILHI